MNRDLLHAVRRSWEPHKGQSVLYVWSDEDIALMEAAVAASEEYVKAELGRASDNCYVFLMDNGQRICYFVNGKTSSANPPDTDHRWSAFIATESQTRPES